MIIITNIRNASMDADEKYAIVRGLKKPITGVQQLASLSPGWAILINYINMKKLGTWNKKTFDEIYTPAFVHQIQNDPEAQKALRDMKARSDAGKSILLMCFCPNADMCHRSIIGKMLEEMGAQVKYV